MDINPDKSDESDKSDNKDNIIRVKIIRHSNRLDYSNPLKWLFYFGCHWNDSPLTENGYSNANQKGHSLANNDYSPAYIYVSPYNRTMATATEIKNAFPKAEMVVEPLLAEYQPGSPHTIALYPKGIPTTYNGTPTKFKYPETINEFSERIMFIIGNLILKNTTDIMIVTHGEVLRSYIDHLKKKFPESNIDSKNVPYLTCLTFNVDKSNNTYVHDSITIE